MATFHVTNDPFRPGIWRIESDQPSALAAVSDALTRTLPMADCVLAIWALHNDEQTELRQEAYAHEQREIGLGALVEIVELPRPREQNVVWVDRYHLLVAGANPAVATRILGLYAGSNGRIVQIVYHRSVAGIIHPQIAAMPNDLGAAWDSDNVLANASFALRYDAGDSSSVVSVRTNPQFAGAAHQALNQLAATVAAW